MIVAVGVWACRARDAGVDALRMEALAPSAKRSKTVEVAGQADKPTAKYAFIQPCCPSDCIFSTCLNCSTHFALMAGGF